MQTDYNPEGISLPAQRQTIKGKAKELGAVIVDEYLEPGNTGTTMAKRPVFRQMMERIRRERDVDYIITYASSRMHRNWKENGAVLLELQQLGVRFVSATENINDDTAEGELLEGIYAVINGFRSRQDGEDIRRKMSYKHEQGGTLHRAPIGYLNVTESVDDRQVRTVVIDPKRGPLVRLAFELYATGSYTLRSLRDKLVEAGLATKPHGKRGAGPISIHLLGNMLRERYYLGYVEWGGVEHKGRHEPLISQDLFDRVQRVLYGDRRAGKRERTHDHYLRGVIWCGRCQARLMIMTGRSRLGVQYHYYVCRGRQERVCDLPYLKIEDVERAVLANYATVRLPDDFRDQAARVMSQAAAESGTTRAALRKQLERQLADIEAKEDHYLDLVGDPSWPKEKLNQRIIALREDRTRIEAQLLSGPSDVQTGLDLFLATLDLLDNPQALYAEASVSVKKVINKAIFTKLYVDVDAEVKVVDDDLNEPFATAIYARRADAGVATQSELRRVVDETLKTAKKRPVPRRGQTNRRSGIAAAPRFTAAASLLCALRVQGSSNADLVGRAGLEPATEGL
ncbi:recombinase family protein [Phytohabitans maris]|uniref:recombinase family protein n=1 Tax=Phytohabitans maris TaxID=3071409 RepID=UPI003D16333F